MPQELVIYGVYLPPSLVVGTLALLLAYATALGLNRAGLSQFFAAPGLVFAAMTVLYFVAVGTFLIPV